MLLLHTKKDLKIKSANSIKKQLVFEKILAKFRSQCKVQNFRPALFQAERNDISVFEGPV